MFRNVQCALLLLFTMASVVSMCTSDNAADSNGQTQGKIVCFDSKSADKREANVVANDNSMSAVISLNQVRPIFDQLEQMMDKYFTFICPESSKCAIPVMFKSEQLFAINKLDIKFVHSQVKWVLSNGDKYQKSQSIYFVRRVLNKISACEQRMKEHGLRIKNARQIRNNVFYVLGAANMSWLACARFAKVCEPIIPGTAGLLLLTFYAMVKSDDLKYDRGVLLHMKLGSIALEEATNMWRELLAYENKVA